MEVKDLSVEEKQELAFTRKRVLYNNKWAANPWKEEAQRVFETRLSDIGKALCISCVSCVNSSV